MEFIVFCNGYDEKGNKVRRQIGTLETLYLLPHSIKCPYCKPPEEFPLQRGYHVEYGWRLKRMRNLNGGYVRFRHFAVRSCRTDLLAKLESMGFKNGVEKE